ncbi:MAG: serine protease [Dehalococcoidia bacterium]|nr:serine protease [Dehalococcoidia bacterium]
MNLKIDYRLGGIPRYRVVEDNDRLMQIPDQVRKCVVFVCYKTTTGINMAGTAFLVGVQLGESVFAYFVTAKHIIDGIRNKSIDQKVYLRMNLRDTGAKLVEISIEQWLSHPSEPSVDVAVLNWAPPHEIFDYRYLPLEMAATQEIIKNENIGVGDDVFLTGLFQSHYGSQRNIPIIRVGNIAAMPEEKVHTEKLGDIDAYLIEARSIAGLSGSPVFAYIGEMRTVEGSVRFGRKGKLLFYLLGLMHGHFEQNKLGIDNLEQDSLINLQINMGIAIVIPVWKIMEVINQEIFANMRDATLRQKQEKTSPVPYTTTDAAS